MKTVAVILASGSGSRFGAGLPKQFTKLAGKPIISYTIKAFQENENIDEIIVVTLSEYIDFVNDIVMSEAFSKVNKVLSGGIERYSSSWAAICAMEDIMPIKVLFHDAVRPFVSQKIISDCVNALDRYNAVDVAVDPTDTIIKVKNNTIMSIPDRKNLMRGQTPQAFKLDFIKKAYQEFLKGSALKASDDCGIFLKKYPNEPIHVVKGEEENFKITHKQDMYLADNIIKDGVLFYKSAGESLIEKKITDKVIVIFGGSSGIGQAISYKARMLGANVYSLSRNNGCDISNSQEIKAKLADILSKEEKIDVVINCAAVLIKKPLSFMSYEEINNSLNVNYLGAINVAKESHSILKESKGCLINFSSSSFSKGRSTYSLYSSSKAAVVNFTQAIAEEWAIDGIRVCCVNPERTATPMRTANFGIENPDTLLDADYVAKATLGLLTTELTGLIVTIKKEL